MNDLALGYCTTQMCRHCSYYEYQMHFYTTTHGCSRPESSLCEHNERKMGYLRMWSVKRSFLLKK
jgi:hypothetical protein